MSPVEPILGPVDFVVVEFADDRPDGSQLAPLLALADADVIRLLDVELLEVDVAGVARAIDTDTARAVDPVLARLVEADSGLLDDADRQLVAEVVTPGRACAVVVVESSWVAALDAQLHASGSHVVATGFVAGDDLTDALSARPAEH